MTQDDGPKRSPNLPGSTASGVRPRSQSHQTLVRAVLTRSAGLLEPEQPHALLATALATADDFLPIDACQVAVLQLDGRGADLYAASSTGELVHRACPLDRGLLGRAVRFATTLRLTAEELRRVADPELDAALRPDLARTVVVLPLKSSTGRVCGALMCSTWTRDDVGEEDLASIAVFASQLGASLELLQARQELRLLNAIVKASHDAIVGIDREDRFTHWNPGAEQLYGYTAEEVLGRTTDLLVPDDKLAEMREIRRRIEEGEHIEQLETVRVTKQGRRVDVSLTLSPIHDASGAFVGVSKIARDITLKRQANERFRLAVESAPNAMVLADERGAILLANGEAERLFGHTREELVGRPIEMLIPQDLRVTHRRHRAAFARDPSRRAMGWGRELWALHKSGSRVPVEVALNPIDEPGQRTVLASVVDISERLRIERERQRLLEDTQQAVEARDAFLSIASHELKTPLTALQLTVQGSLRALSRRAGVEHDDFLFKKLRSANRQVLRLGGLIDQLLDVSRITAGRLKLEPDEIDLRLVLRDVVDRFAQGFDTCAIQLPDGPAVVGYWDASRLDQLFTNLVANAVKYGEGKPIDVQLVMQERDAVVAVRDRGAGIAPEDQARIFERFERLVSHRQHGGFGLGLWIVRQLVEAHGGRIEVHSAVGEGSTFLVTLPREPPRG